jgi:hypothetical protein
MTKSTLPAADAGLPAIDRRSLVCGLGTAAVAGVPAIGIAAPTNDDPVFQVMAALSRTTMSTSTTSGQYATRLTSSKGSPRHEQDND